MSKQGGRNNLNPFYKVWYRKTNNWLRRRFLHRLFPNYYRRLLDERRRIILEETISGEKLTRAQLARLGNIADKLGEGVVYRLTPEQQERASRIAKEIVVRLRAEGKVKQ